MDKNDATAAGTIASAALIASLISRLRANRILSDEDVKETYDSALLDLETAQGADSDTAHIFEAARRLLEDHLRTLR